MTPSDDLVDRLRSSLPRHAEVLDGLVRGAEDDERWRWVELGCSVAAGRGDGWSDLDAGLGWGGDLADGIEAGEALVRTIGVVDDLLVHELAGRAAPHRRLAVQFTSGVQLDLVVMLARDRPGLPPGSVALLDRDGTLAEPWVPSIHEPPDAATLREWAFLGWWALGDAGKYLARGAVHEAAAQVAEARSAALRLHAAARHLPYAVFGLTTLLDAPEPALPMWLDETYGTATVEAQRAAAAACVRLLADAQTATAIALGVELDPAMATAAKRRLGGTP